MSGLFIHRFTTFISYQKANHITTVFPHTSTSTTVVNPPPCSPCPPRLWEGGGGGCVAVMSAQRECVPDIEWSVAAEGLIACACWDETIRVGNLR